jgi:RNA-directed DNA polymerase
LSLNILLPQVQRIANEAKADPERVFTNLAHLIDEALLREAYWRTRKDGAVGVDRVSGRDYEANLDANLRDLHQRLKEKRYRAHPVRRVYIDKEPGKKRPLGIPAFEDKIVQRAVVMLLEAVYEQDFLYGSYGFRPKRSAHQALHDLREWCMQFLLKNSHHCANDWAWLKSAGKSSLRKRMAAHMDATPRVVTR